jgi:hypothetical protein
MNPSDGQSPFQSRTALHTQATLIRVAMASNSRSNCAPQRGEHDAARRDGEEHQMLNATRTQNHPRLNARSRRSAGRC